MERKREREKEHVFVSYFIPSHTVLGMAKEGFIRCVENIENKLKLSIAVLSTDRHVQIKHVMKSDPRLKLILHKFDPWHFLFRKKWLKLQRRQVGWCYVIFYFTCQFIIFFDNFA